MVAKTTEIEEKEETVEEEEEEEEDDEDEVRCGICYDGKCDPKTKCSKCSNGHSFGNPCLTTVLDAAITQRKVTFECPAIGENCQACFPESVVESLVSTSAMSKHKHNQIASALGQEVRYCAQCKMPGFLDAADLNQAYFECAAKTCDATTCSQRDCGRRFHPHVSCDEAAMTVALDKRNDIKYQAELEKNLRAGIALCSGCGVGYLSKKEQGEDCMKVQCPNCHLYTCMCCGHGISTRPQGFDMHGYPITAYTAHFKFATKSAAMEQYRKDVEARGEDNAKMPCYTWPDEVGLSFCRLLVCDTMYAYT